jgi:hypothetical protein
MMKQLAPSSQAVPQQPDYRQHAQSSASANDLMLARKLSLLSACSNKNMVNTCADTNQIADNKVQAIICPSPTPTGVTSLSKAFSGIIQGQKLTKYPFSGISRSVQPLGQKCQSHPLK